MAQTNESSAARLVTSGAWDESEITAPVLDETGTADTAAVSCDLQNPKVLRWRFSLQFLVSLASYVCGKLIGLRSEQVDYLIMRSMLVLAKAAQRKEQQLLAAAV